LKKSASAWKRKKMRRCRMVETLRPTRTPSPIPRKPAMKLHLMALLKAKPAAKRRKSMRIFSDWTLSY